MAPFALSTAAAAAAILFGLTTAFDISRSDNVVVYWGQNSLGATNAADVANFQKPLGDYCDDDTIDTFPIAFMDVYFGQGGMPQIDLSNTCNAMNQTAFNGTALLDCSFMASDIKKCQSKGKIVTLSMGGATGPGAFQSDAQATAFADTVWNVFLGGNSTMRPFGAAVLDGIDLDIEGGGSGGYVAFINQLRTHFTGASKKFFITGAPQCPFPDGNMGDMLNAAHFDAVYVQFYNNFCGLQNFDNVNAWNFGQWDNWAKTQSPNKDVKIYIGAPAGTSAAGTGFVDAATLTSIAAATRANYSSFGGLMFWDASQALANDNYAAQAKTGLTSAGPPTQPPPPASSSASSSASAPPAPSSSAAPPPPSSSAAPPPPSSSSAAPPASSSAAPPPPPPPPPPANASTAAPPSSTGPAPGDACSNPPWDATTVYVRGNTVTFQGHAWSANWWSTADTPGGDSGDWTDLGACPASSKKRALRHARARLMPARVHSRSWAH